MTSHPSPPDHHPTLSHPPSPPVSLRADRPVRGNAIPLSCSARLSTATPHRPRPPHYRHQPAGPGQCPHPPTPFSGCPQQPAEAASCGSLGDAPCMIVCPMTPASERPRSPGTLIPGSPLHTLSATLECSRQLRRSPLPGTAPGHHAASHFCRPRLTAPLSPHYYIPASPDQLSRRRTRGPRVRGQAGARRAGCRGVVHLSVLS